VRHDIALEEFKTIAVAAKMRKLKTMTSLGGAEMLISPHVVLPTLLILILIGLFLWNDRQNRNRH
jgi:hypothetical protein